MTNVVAQTILAQLGGRKFLAMTGAYSLTSGPDRLSGRLPSRSTTNGAWGFIVSLNSRDLYDVRILKLRKFEVIELEGAKDVYCDMLQEVFTSLTGLATHL